MTRILILCLISSILVACKEAPQTNPEENLDFVLQLLTPTDSLEQESKSALFGMVTNGNYLESLQDMLQRKESLLQQYPTDMYYQALGTSLSTVGEYQTVLESWNRLMGEPPRKPNQDSLQQALKTVALKEAKGTIVAAAADQQVLMINEAHHVALHRVFTRSLLQDLYDLGYRYFAAETFSHGDIDRLNQEKVPLLKSGVYLCEPQYANLARTALEIGFELLAYEEQGSLTGSQRDSVQARNLAQVFERDSTAKLLVHAGYAHIYERTNSEWIKMAQWFQEFTGIDPLTINQVALTEKGDLHYENAHYTALLANQEMASAAVPIQNDQFWMTARFQGLVDMLVIHPRTNYPNERAHWLQKEDYQALKIPQAKLEKALLIQAFKASETERIDINQLVPLDHVLVKNRDRDKYLFVPQYEKYIIRILDANSQVLEQYE
ncbi:MAG: hypothetical protein AAF927_28140 [Bacteroidota bacterium]